VSQRCVDHATGPQRERLVDEVATNALALSQDPFGNYVVQYVLELGLTAPSAKVRQNPPLAPPPCGSTWPAVWVL
jgi:hypothetical protein